MIAADRDLRSLATLAAELQVPSRTIENVLLELQLAPALRLNAIYYLDGNQVEAVANRIRELLGSH